MTNRSPLILLFSGWAGSGKDVAAALLTEELQFVREAFADSLKQDAHQATEIPLSYFHSAAKDYLLEPRCLLYPTAVTPRDVLLMHARAKRAVDPDVFTRAVIERIQGEAQLSRYVISDWRYRRELDLVRAAFPNASVVTVGITRKGVKQQADPSEHDLDRFPFDLQIANDGCISDLRDALRHQLRPLLLSAA